MRLLEVRMLLCQARIICLKRGYLSPNEGKLASEVWFARVAVNHPIQIINVLSEACHKVQSDISSH